MRGKLAAAAAVLVLAGCGAASYDVVAPDGSRLARVLYPRLSEHELIAALSHLVRAIRDRNPNRLPAGDYLNQTSDAELKRPSVS